MNNCHFIPRLFALLLLAGAAAGCGFSEENDPTPRAYNLNKPDKFSMPESLLEISGIAFNKAKGDTVYAIQDEEGKLFRLAWDIPKQYNARFSKHGDYEDVSIINDKVIVLKSNGHLYSFALSNATKEDADNVQEWKNLLPPGEYEGLYGDEATDQLYVLCKNCDADDAQKQVTGYIFKFADSIHQLSTFEIDVSGIPAIKAKKSFRPSALAKNPLTNEWYIVSAVNKLLVITDSNWKVKETYPLNSNTFNQPEGIAFDKAGNLYISNEGDDLVKGNILLFRRLNP
jgi:DNA-binding beta-propeller fold protein YncE